MKTRVLAALAFTTLLGARVGVAAAQTVGPQLTLSARGGMLLPDSATRPELDNGPLVAGSVGILPYPHFGVEGTYGAAFTKQTGGPDARVNHVGLDAVGFLLPGRRFDPYILGGWAELEYDPDHGETQTLNGWEAGAGVIMRLVPHVALRLDARDVMVDQDVDNKWLHNPIVTAGAQFSFGGKLRDTDGDGVADRTDKCVDTPLGARVDASGCPSDADGDGVFDGIDTCPDTPRGAHVDAKGCPNDADGDGVFDGVDECADTPQGAKVDAHGCPLDTDGDGVPDGVDTCDATPTRASVDTHGCPLDSDGDGVYDGIDRCPNTAAGVTVDSVGCPPVVHERMQQLLDTGVLRFDTIQFATGKATLLKSSFATLDEIGKALQEWPEIPFEIGGYTDSQGAAQANLELSARRARAVLDYLEKKFPKLNRSQYTAVGYGESAPVADNGTSAGRAKNRRVELKLLDRDALQKEIERRQQQGKP